MAKQQKPSSRLFVIMKRITLEITTDRPGSEKTIGYLVVSDVKETSIRFFAPRKFPIEETLTMISLEKDPIQYKAVVTACAEEISSGKIMQTLPEEGQPFPARTFVRILAQIIEKKPLNSLVDETHNNVISLKPEQSIKDSATAA